MAPPSDNDNSFALPSEGTKTEPSLNFKIARQMVNTKKFNSKALRSVLLAAWKLVDGVQIENLQDGSIVCSFTKLTD